MADVPRAALRGIALAAQELDHLRLRISREPELVADAAVVRQRRADEAGKRPGDEAALPGKAEKRLRVSGRAQARGDHVGEDEAAAGFELYAPQPQQGPQLVGR